MAALNFGMGPGWYGNGAGKLCPFSDELRCSCLRFYVLLGIACSGNGKRQRVCRIIDLNRK
jgi:hypothetical protein